MFVVVVTSPYSIFSELKDTKDKMELTAREDFKQVLPTNFDAYKFNFIKSV